MAEYEFMITSGWNADYEDLLPLSDTTLDILEPRQEEVQPGRSQILMDGSAQIDGGWQSAVIFDEYFTAARHNFVLTRCSLVTDSEPVTVLALDRNRVWGYWNAIIYRPNPLPSFREGLFQGKMIYPLSLIQYLGAPA